MLVTAMVDENVTEDLIPEEMKQRMVVGGADRIAEQIKTKVFDAGIDGVIMNLPTSIQGYQPGHITALGAALKPLVTV
jgi:alkanesulfonate monooxygenase SsuD/methylene tetrahydromethanopterin reductase-like flavin-dependent oxidoreductase (luciferase family)